MLRGAGQEQHPHHPCKEETGGGAGVGVVDIGDDVAAAAAGDGAAELR